jgi:hypothetical protein
MMKMTIPQLRYLLSLGLTEDHQLWPDGVAPDAETAQDEIFLLPPPESTSGPDVAGTEPERDR